MGAQAINPDRGAELPICDPYSILLPVGFAVPLPLPVARCALAAPFHPCPYPKVVGGLLSVALSLTPANRDRRALPGTVFPWSPDFPRCICMQRGRPALWHGQR